MNKRLHIAAVTVLMAGCLAFPVWAGVTNQVVAVVGQQIITLLDLDRFLGPRLKQLEEAQSGSQLETARKRLRAEALERMIVERLTQIEAEKLGISVTDEDLARAEDHVMEINRVDKEGLIKALAKDGLSVEEFREALKGQLLRSRLVYLKVKPKIVIPESTKRALYEANKENYKGFVEVEIRRILLDSGQDELAARVRQDLEAGADFIELAARYSKGPEAKDGGLLGDFQLDQLSQQIREAIQDLEAGQVSSPVQTREGIQLFQVSSKKIEPGQSFEDVEPQLTEELIQKELDQKFKEMINETRQRSYVKVMEIKD